MRPGRAASFRCCGYLTGSSTQILFFRCIATARSRQAVSTVPDTRTAPGSHGRTGHRRQQPRTRDRPRSRAGSPGARAARTSAAPTVPGCHHRPVRPGLPAARRGRAELKAERGPGRRRTGQGPSARPPPPACPPAGPAAAPGPAAPRPSRTGRYRAARSPAASVRFAPEAAPGPAHRTRVATPRPPGPLARGHPGSAGEKPAALTSPPHCHLPVTPATTSQHAPPAPAVSPPGPLSSVAAPPTVPCPTPPRTHPPAPCAGQGYPGGQQCSAQGHTDPHPGSQPPGTPTFPPRPPPPRPEPVWAPRNASERPLVCRVGLVLLTWAQSAMAAPPQGQHGPGRRAGGGRRASV